MPPAIDQATHAHIALAAALASLWAALPPLGQHAVQAQIEMWNNDVYDHDSAEAHLDFLQRRLSDELGNGARAALGEAEIDTNFLQSLYSAVVKRVTDVYAGSTPTTAVIDADLEINYSIDSPYSDGMTLAVCGGGSSASYGRDPLTRILRTRLTLCPSRLGPPSLAVVPYLLCHELICHAFQASKFDVCDPYAEGYMDRVALSLHSAWAPVLFPLAPQLALDEAEMLSHLARLNCGLHAMKHVPSRAKAARSVGAAAAGILSRVMDEANIPPSPTSLSRFHELSIAMNVVEADVDERSAFAVSVHAADRDPLLRFKLTAYLQRWAHGDCDAVDVLHFDR